MCFYSQTSFECGDWKWGNMMEQCPRQHRIGETCGAKLVHHESSTQRPGELCRICQEMEVKRRRLQKLQDNINRWEPQGITFKASLEKAKLERAQTIEKLKELNSRRSSVLFRGPAAGSDAQSGTSFSYFPGSRGGPQLSTMVGNGYGGNGSPGDMSNPVSDSRHDSRTSPYSMRR